MRVKGWTDGRMDMPMVTGTFRDYVNVPIEDSEQR